MSQYAFSSHGRSSPTSASERTIPLTPDTLVGPANPFQSQFISDSAFSSQRDLFNGFGEGITTDMDDKSSGSVHETQSRTPSLRKQPLNQLFPWNRSKPTHSRAERLKYDGHRHFGSHHASQDDVQNSSRGTIKAVGFWDSTLSTTRKEVFQAYWQTLLILCIAIFSILSIYWGFLVDVKNNLHRATVAVVSFEGQVPFQNYTPIVGPFVQRAIEAELSSRPDHLGFRFFQASDFDNSPDNVRLAVFEQEYWAAIIINANATASLVQAVQTGDETYDPYGAALIVYEQSRDIESYNFYIIPVLNRLSSAITSSFATFWAREVFTNNSFDPAVYLDAPQSVSPGISFGMLDLRPFDPPSAIPTITIGLIYLIIVAFFSFTFFVPIHMRFVAPNPASPHPPLKFHQHILYRWCATITAYLFLSLAYSLVSLAFLIPFSISAPTQHSLSSSQGGWSSTESAFNANPFGHGTFLVYWQLNFVGMAALGLPCENMAMLLSALSPLPYAALFLIWWVITNVSTGFYALEIANDFYRWGYVWPLRQVVEGSKTLVFGTRNQLWLNFGVLFVWIVVSSLIFPLACWVMRWKHLKDRAQTVR